ncbi:MAG: PIN domain-containing protein [Bacteroidetes bacterium]|nr:PIN domain-containing protein [Bacteroidota bacterium]
MRVFLDTNVLLDVLDADRPFHADSTRIFKAVESQPLDLVLTGLSLVNTEYILRRQGVPKQKLRAFLATLCSFCATASTDLPQLEGAISADWPDFEDAVQYHAALTHGRVQVIVTNDVPGFKESRIPVMTPGEFALKYLDALEGRP